MRKPRQRQFLLESVTSLTVEARPCALPSKPPLSSRNHSPLPHLRRTCIPTATRRNGRTSPPPSLCWSFPCASSLILFHFYRWPPPHPSAPQGGPFFVEKLFILLSPPTPDIGSWRTLWRTPDPWCVGIGPTAQKEA